jgi:hypothetical protein
MLARQRIDIRNRSALRSALALGACSMLAGRQMGHFGSDELMGRQM